jgi:hypothetical protein
MKTIQELILDVQDRISLPLDDDDRWSTTALVRAFNNALDDKLTPDLVAEGSNYLVHREVVALTANGNPVFPLNSVPLPKRAVGRALREVKYLPAGKTKIEDELNCPAISLEEKDMFSSESEIYGSSVPYVFLENDSLRLVGGDLAGSIVMYYSLEPSMLENIVNRYAKIIGYSFTPGVIYISAESAGTQWDTFCPSGQTKLFDIYLKSTGAILKSNIRALRSGNLYTLAVNDTQVTEFKQIFAYQTGGFPIETGYENDLILLPAGKSEFSTIPYEFDQLLVLYVCERVLESLGDTEGLQVVMAKIKETKDSVSRVTGNRLQGERRKLTDRRSIARIQRGQKWTRNYNKNHT